MPNGFVTTTPTEQYDRGRAAAEKVTTTDPASLQVCIAFDRAQQRDAQNSSAEAFHRGRADALAERAGEPAHNCWDDAVPYVSDGPLGHGWECGTCGAFLQAG
jgi:hypothetical protein